MKSIKTLILLLVLVGPFTANVAHAYRGHFYGGFHGPHIGVFIDPWPLFYPLGYYPYGYYPYAAYPPVVVAQQAAPTTYIEQGNAAPAQAPDQQNTNRAPSPASSDWYYCRKSSAYYPYVRTCAEGWQRVPSQPQN